MRKLLFIIGVSGVGLIALGLITYGVWSLWPRYQATHNPSPIIRQEVVTNSTQTPDETKPEKACASYKAAATHPERLNIPALGVEGCIERVGVDQHGAIAVPTNIHTAGWFVDSVSPGSPGLSIIDGHINGNFTNDGIFQHLGQLATGDDMTLTRGNGTVLHFKVVSVESVPLNKAAEVLFTHDPTIESQLNLITCGGVWNKSMKQFDHRIIAKLALVQS